MACTRFWLQGKMKVVSLTYDMPTGPPLHPYQISKYLYGHQSYGAHKDASIFLTQQQKTK